MLSTVSARPYTNLVDFPPKGGSGAIGTDQSPPTLHALTIFGPAPVTDTVPILSFTHESLGNKVTENVDTLMSVNEDV